MEDFQSKFIELALHVGALRFGEFKLKSGRLSPYFFDAGKFCSGKPLAELGRCYAEAIVNSGIAFDLLFGPAYKGIPLSAAAAIALADSHHRDVPYCFNRKEAKDHGEGGSLVGASLRGQVLIVDDVITAGTAIREVMSIIVASGAKPAGVVVGLDRRERGRGQLSAIQEVEQEFGITVTSIISMDDIISYLELRPESADTLAAVVEYRHQYGIGEA